MAGQIVSRGDRIWLVRVFLGRDSQTGKRRYHNKTVRGSKKDAQKYLNGVLREIDLGTFVEPSPMCLSEYLDNWLAVAAKPRLSEQSHADYVYLLKQYVRPNIGGLKLMDIKPMDIQSLYTKLSDKGLSPRTVRYIHVLLTSAFKQGIRWRLLAQNPAAYAELPKMVRKEMQALSPEEATRFLRAASDHPYNLIFMFALVTGMRPEEYLAIQWKDVDFERQTVTVQRAVVFRRRGNQGGYYFTEPKTSQSRRTIPLPIKIIQALQVHKRNQSEHRLRIGPNYQNLDLVFATEKGSPMNRQNLGARAFKTILKNAELPTTIRLYDLRHTCATLLLAAGENPKVVSERLGHSTIVLTLDIYSHVLPSMQRAATEKLETMLFEKSGTL